MARIFVSHSSLDADAAKDIMAWLRAQGFDNAFLDIDERNGLQVGQQWEARLYEELAACSAVVLLVTPHWLASKWCFAEFVQARASGKAIFPIILTPDGGQAFAGDLQRVDFSIDAEQGKRALAQSLAQLALRVQSGFSWDAQRAPYPGLPAFEREDAAVYFGRDHEVGELIEMLRARHRRRDARMVAVLGASGSGKSSLVRAGVLPRLARFATEFVVVPPLRPGTDPCAELAKALAEALGTPLQWRELRERLLAEPQAWADVVSDLLMAGGRREGTLLFTIDQAEELFATTPAEARAAFDGWLRRLQSLPVVLLLTLRSDRLGELQQWAQGIGGFEQFSLPPLPHERLALVIEGPARVAGVSIAPGLADAVLHDAGGPDAMPLLAFTLRELWARAMADAGIDGPVIRLADYQALADAPAGLNPLENAVRRRADELVAPLDAGARQALREAFVGALARIDDQGVYGRRAAAWDELDSAVHATLETFVDARLLVARSDDAGRRSVEVAHESLLRKWPLLCDWLDDERAFLIGRLQLQRALDDWQSAAPAQRDSALLQGLMLERARAWLADKPRGLSTAQREFIAASVAAADARRRAARRKWALIGSAGVLALTLIAGLGVYLRQERLASASLAVEVEADRWLQRASAALAYGQPDRALAQATRAAALLPGAKTRSALWQAQVALPSQWAFAFPAVDAAGELPATAPLGAVSALAWSPDGSALLIGERSGGLFRLDTEGARPLAAVPAERKQAPSKDLPEAVLALGVTDDGARLAVLEDGRFLRQRAGAERFEVLGQVDALQRASVGATGEALVLLQDGRALHWLDCLSTSPCLQREAVPGFGPVAALALDAKGQRFAAADDDGRVVVGDASGALTRLVLPLPAGTRVMALALDARSRRLAVAVGGGQVLAFDAEGNELARLATQSSTVQQLAWAPGGERLIVDCETGSLCLWQLQPGSGMTLAAVLAVRGAGGGALAWSADGRRLAGGDLSGRVQVWDMAATPAGSAVLRDAGAAPMSGIDVQGDGRRIAGADVRGQVRVWELPSLRLAQRLSHPLAGESLSLRFHPLQPQLALATLGGGAAVFATEGGALLGSVEGSFDTLAWDAGPDRLLSGGQDGVVRSHAVAAGQSLALPEPHADAVIALAVAPGASAVSGAPPVVLSADTRGVIKARRGEGAAGTWATAARADGKPFGVGALGFAPDGKAWLAAGNSGDVLVFDSATHRLLHRLETAADQVNDAAYSPDGRFIAALDNVGRVWLWRAADGRRHATLWLRNEPGRAGNDAFGVLGQLRRLAWLPDAQRLAIATQSGVAVLLPLPRETLSPTTATR